MLKFACGKLVRSVKRKYTFIPPEASSPSYFLLLDSKFSQLKARSYFTYTASLTADTPFSLNASIAK